MVHRCRIRGRGEKRCKEPVFVAIKVEVLHPDKLRRSWQTWHLCEGHWLLFNRAAGKGYYAWFREKDETGNAPVLSFRVIG